MREDAAVAPRAPILSQLLLFASIGGGAALGFVVLSTAMIGLRTGVPAWLVSALCYAAFIVPVYLLHRRFSFNSAAPHGRALPRYVAVQVAGLGLAALFSVVAYSLIHMSAPLAPILVIGLTSGINFVVLRRWAFSGS